jgi:hypothetical protein
MDPTPDQITVALHALTDDATDWSHAAADLRLAANVAGGQSLPAPAFSFAGAEAAAGYDALRLKFTGLLTAGATNLDDIAHALTAAATSYAADEEAHVHRLRGIY